MWSIGDWGRSVQARRWPWQALVGVTAGMVVSAGVVIDTAAPASAQPVAPATQSVTQARAEQVLSRLDEVSALVTARSQGSKVLVEDLLEETSTTWVNPDGTLTTQTFGAPVRQRAEDGSWVDINLDLKAAPGSDEVVAAESPVELALPGTERVVPAAQAGQALGLPKTRTETDLAQATAGEDGSVVLGWPGTLPEVDLEGTEATFTDAAPGVDVQVTSQRTGFETFFVLDHAPTPGQSASWTLPLTLTGVTHRTEKDGSISFLDPAGDVVSSIPTAWAWDSAVDAASGDPAVPSPVTLSTKVVASSGAGADARSRVLLTVTPDAAWLADPARQYPVTVDPTYAALTMRPEFDTYIQSDTTFDASTRTELRAGTFDGGTTKARSLLSFNLDTIRGKQVQSAALNLYETYAYSCTAREVQAWHTSGATSATRWSNQPTWHSKQGALTTAKGYSASCAAGWISIPMTDLAKTFAAASTSTASGVVGVRAASETDSAGWKKFASSETSYIPSITVTYNRAPALPAAPTVEGAGTNDGILYVNNAKPVLSTKASDPDGNTVKYDIQVHSSTAGDASSLASGCTTALVASAATAACTAGTALANGTQYFARAKSTDQLGLTPGWQGWTRFRTALTAPAAPAVTCPGYADKSWTSAPPSADLQCTVSTSNGGYTGAVKLSTRSDSNAIRGDETVVGGRTMSVTVPVSKKAGGHVITATATGPSGLTTSRTYTFGYGPAGITAPVDQTTSSDQFAIRASAPPAGSATGVTATVQYRPADTDGTTVPAWVADAPVKVVTDKNTSGYVVDNQPWDATTAAEAITGSDRVPALMQLRVCFTYTYTSGSPTTQCTGDGVAPTVLRVPHAFGDGYPVTDTDAGQVALWTGEFATGATDVEAPTPTGALTISRTHATYAGPTTPTTGIFGPGWSAELDGPMAGLAGMTVTDTTRAWGPSNSRGDGTISLTTDDGEALTWRQPGGTRVQDKPGTYEPVGEDTELSGTTLTLTYDNGAKAPSAAMLLALTEADGTRTTFRPKVFSTTNDTTWAPVAVIEPEDLGTTSYTTDGVGRVTRILADVPDGTSCAPTAMQPGCRALRLEYATTTTATTTVTGAYKDQLARVWLDAYDPDKNTVTATEMATYAYDGAGRLALVTGPRAKSTDSTTRLTTKYGYDGNTTRLRTITPPGLKPFTITYQDATNAAGSTRPRTATIQRDPLATGGPTSVEASFVYGIDPAAPSSSGLPNLSPDTVNQWGQASAPTYGAAVFGADHPVTSTDPHAITAADWPYAQLSYTDGLGYTVNTADHGPDGWQSTATDYDENGNVTRELDARGLATFLTERATTGGQNLDADPYATITRYNAATETTPAGMLVTDTWGPARTAVLANGTTSLVRPHVVTRYDEGAPTDSTRLFPYWLPTSTTTGVANVETATSDPAVAVPADVETLNKTVTGYGPELGGVSGWDLGMPTSTRTVLNGATADDAKDIVRRTAYDTAGGVIKSSQPASTGTDAGTTLTTYYTTAANPAQTQCGSKPEWDGLVCMVGPAAVPSSGPTMPTTTTTGYSLLLAPSEVRETSGDVTRTTRTTYLDDGRVNTTSTTVEGLTGAAASTPVPDTKNAYDPATGAQTAVANLAADGTTTGAVKTAYDQWGRTTSYTDTDGAVTTTTYVTPGRAGAGQVDKVTDPKGTTTYAYGTDANGQTEYRSLPTAVTLSDVGTYKAAYDADGAMTLQTMPGGIRQDTTYDTAGEPVALSYSGLVTAPDGTTSTDVWLSWTQDNDVTGRVRHEWTPTVTAPNADLPVADPDATVTTPATAYDRSYSYDRAERLVRVVDRTATTGGAALDDPATSTTCQARDYTFDRNGNRTTLKTTNGGTDGTCPAAGATGGAATSWAYDNADRTRTTGYTYDQLGRTLTIPAVDAPDPTAGVITLSYNHTDAITKITQGPASTAFGYDAAGRRTTDTTTTTGATTSTSAIARHYGSPDDNPTWTIDTAPATSGTGTTTTTTRYLRSLGGDLSATHTTTGAQTSVQLTLANLHGDIAATVPLPDVNGPAAGIDSWSTYLEYGARTAGTGVSALNYGWLGTKQRAVTTAGLTLMGARVYNPATGRFTALDPIRGGNANAYTYPLDPVNFTDINGERGAALRAALKALGKLLKAAWKGLKWVKLRLALEAAKLVLRKLNLQLPSGYRGAWTNNRKGVVFRPKGVGSDSNRGSVRIQMPNQTNKHVYMRYYNRQGNGQPINPRTGKPGTGAETHIDLSTYTGPFKNFP